MKVYALLLSALLGLVLMSITSGSAEAQSRTCKRLETQLASLGSGSNRSNRSIRRALKQQERQIVNAKRRMQRLGCSKRRLFFFSDGHPSCGRLRGALDRMRANRVSLQRQASRGSGASVKRQRSRIQREMRRHQCGVRRTARRNTENSTTRRAGPSQRADTQRQAARQAAQRQRERERRAARRKAQAEKKRLAKLASTPTTSRTMCVRTCDGYFFPAKISVKSAKKGDVKTCESLCPGTQMELFFEAEDSDDPRTMVSLTSGRRYSQLPTAFSYRSSFNPNCSCNFRQAVKKPTAVAGDELKPKARAAAAQKDAVVRIALPAWRPDLAADPDTAANRRGNLDLAALTIGDANRRVSAVSGRTVREVGERFLPTQ
ncbi:MAG: DUF2865 domain-containing protein [Ahrensia sp.]|nr:DUF2865 domain-containing protein [Ahrensia sp.]